MTELPMWADDPGALGLTEKQYDELPDTLRTLIEIIDGNVIRSKCGSAEHSDVARRLANHLEAAKPDAPCLRVSSMSTFISRGGGETGPSRSVAPM
ncbi:hypothetical protein [Nocardia sp. NPDC046763]|uniref:hypothetical protein n=1 Tax=Nocardia sp. NPDC046763 TaxID=3155256 RepID=UPI0033D989F2